MYIPEAWKAALKAAQSASPRAIIGGGALRDLAWGFEAKDLDIFFPDEDCDKISQAFPQGTLVAGDEYRPMNSNEVSWVMESLFDGCPPLNLIGIRGPSDKTFENHVRTRMDFAACQVTYDGNLIRYTGVGAMDTLNRKMTLRRAESAQDIARSLKRAARFKERLKGIEVDLKVLKGTEYDEYA